MTDATVLDLLNSALMMSAKLAGPALGVALAVGVIISLVQVVTQIQEMTLTFVPKLIAVCAVLVFAGPWMLRELVNWVVALWTQIAYL